MYAKQDEQKGKKSLTVAKESNFMNTGRLDGQFAETS